MPHIIDIDHISENLFILQNLSLASRSFCEKYRISYYSKEESEFDWYYYLGWLKPIVSEKLIDCAIKVRILQDFLREEDEEDEEIDFADLDQRACSDLVLGQFHAGSDPLTLREACNKIIHATKVNLVWKDVASGAEDERTADEDRPEYWNDSVMLEGSKGNREWKFELYVVDFCIALERFLSELVDSVNWDGIYKDDI
ncbi:MAG: hypothetical protein KFBDDELM_00197 [Candidatus Argoarchaeum ethanivorans]|uniref:Uncharacterized protein n=1 Tax=Candidatus Argoarchaeum ethanivorans TaxID=2608793 RepID=A0A811T8I4_9EURY|nr:MAG: hypothetical protein KFBDDELM_00197 [Candidatus Argoarchaeum ethanivorans]CAD6492641.1 MAG: hypothetical protein DIAAKJNI_00343 [Candidatus Argoarchaeum ethanivorans]